MDVSKHASQINKEDPILDDLQSQGCYSFRNGLSNAKDQLIQFEQ